MGPLRGKFSKSERKKPPPRNEMPYVLHVGLIPPGKGRNFAPRGSKSQRPPQKKGVSENKANKPTGQQANKPMGHNVVVDLFELIFSGSEQ